MCGKVSGDRLMKLEVCILLKEVNMYVSYFEVTCLGLTLSNLTRDRCS